MPADSERPADFYCPKGYCAVPVQDLVDHRYSFMCFSGRCVGATHDSLAHYFSGLGTYLKSGGSDSEFWIVGDEAYNCDESLITPILISLCSGSALDLNYFLSSYRVF